MEGIAGKKRRKRVLRTQPRARTESARQLRREVNLGWSKGDYPEGLTRPETRADCSPCEACAEFVRAVVNHELPQGTAPSCGHDPMTSLNRCRPCPWVGCSAHLYADVSLLTGAVKVNFPHRQPTELDQTCVHDVAEGGPVTLEEIGEMMNLTRERIRQVESIGLRKLRAILRKTPELMRAMLTWLSDLDRRVTPEELYTSPVSHGDGPALSQMITDWEKRAGVGLSARVLRAVGDEALTLPKIMRRMPAQTTKSSVKNALQHLIATGKLERHTKRVSRSNVTVYRRPV